MNLKAVTIQLDMELAKQIKEMGKAERRSMSAQAAMCIQVGAQELKRRSELVKNLEGTQASGLAAFMDGRA